ncbi:metallophosphoesterase [Sedimentibacter hydroxybenzoicus DSM 7310]|uniref:Metallophosphoesterase n=1 Tax=Sedimentibacter hydroxybenzoicus DSM 7310 TaxID=1123245 RepID=A0A974BID6_SEDHY|nr:metallophosphoesterase [Sedimentibacter hydroxybenzoicus]NYB73677.1 metallophosphoesterase [Sedimentibacter hydroxybenzoicus DSM 7310]
MKIFAIADLHFDSQKEKPMNVFGDNWINHEEKIIENWKKVVGEDDLVLIPGDISWAVKLNEAIEDLLRIDELPGIKIIGKGNHDYWWSTSSKLDKLNLKTIKFLKNNSYEFDGVSVCGTRGWDTMEEHADAKSNEKIYLRELNRLKISLECAGKKGGKIIVMLHYPPFNSIGLPNEFFQMLKEFQADICIYGHLHGEDGHKNVKEGLIDQVQVHCVSSDYMDFKPKRIQ